MQNNQIIYHILSLTCIDGSLHKTFNGLSIQPDSQYFLLFAEDKDHQIMHPKTDVQIDYHTGRISSTVPKHVLKIAMMANCDWGQAKLFVDALYKKGNT